MDLLARHEEFEMEVLYRMNSGRILEKLVFGGGTMLRLCHELNRYSADLDFWLIRTVKNRQRTIMRIVESILNLQKDFFDRGPLFLKPLQLKEVSAILGIHKSTVSRAISGKYIQTPYGIFKLRYGIFKLRCRKTLEQKEHSHEPIFSPPLVSR